MGSFADYITEATGVKTTAEVSQASAANMTALQDGEAILHLFKQISLTMLQKVSLMFDGEIIDNVSAIGAFTLKLFNWSHLKKTVLKHMQI